MTHLSQTKNESLPIGIYQVLKYCPYLAIDSLLPAGLEPRWSDRRAIKVSLHVLGCVWGSVWFIYLFGIGTRKPLRNESKNSAHGLNGDPFWEDWQDHVCNVPEDPPCRCGYNRCSNASPKDILFLIGLLLPLLLDKESASDQTRCDLRRGLAIESCGNGPNHNRKENANSLQQSLLCNSSVDEFGERSIRLLLYGRRWRSLAVLRVDLNAVLPPLFEVLTNDFIVGNVNRLHTHLVTFELLHQKISSLLNFVVRSLGAYTKQPESQQ